MAFSKAAACCCGSGTSVCGNCILQGDSVGYGNWFNCCGVRYKDFVTDAGQPVTLPVISVNAYATCSISADYACARQGENYPDVTPPCSGSGVIINTAPASQYISFQITDAPIFALSNSFECYGRFLGMTPPPAPNGNFDNIWAQNAMANVQATQQLPFVYNTGCDDCFCSCACNGVYLDPPQCGCTYDNCAGPDFPVYAPCGTCPADTYCGLVYPDNWEGYLEGSWSLQWKNGSGSPRHCCSASSLNAGRLELTVGVQGGYSAKWIFRTQCTDVVGTPIEGFVCPANSTSEGSFEGIGMNADFYPTGSDGTGEGRLCGLTDCDLYPPIAGISCPLLGGSCPCDPDRPKCLCVSSSTGFCNVTSSGMAAIS